MRLVTLLLLTPIFLPLAAQVVERNEEPLPTPVWFSLTAGGAGTRLTCDLCQSARDVGPAFTLAAGVVPSPRLRVGIEAGRWTFEDDDVRERVLTLGLVTHLVPNADRGLFLLGGIGWSGYRAGEFSYDAPRLTVGLGWELPLSGDWMVGNLVALDATAFAPIKNEDVTVMRNVALSTVRVSMQLRRR